MNGEINIHAKFILKPSFIESKQNMDIPAIVLAFIFGLLIGSFLNVVIYRLPVMLHQESRQAAQEYLGLPVETLPTFNLMTPPSRCGQCGARVKPWQNIPIISWLLLRGQCAGCHTKISIRYPLVELLTGILFALVAWRYGWTWYTVGACLFTAYVVAMTFIDADTQLLPDELTVPLIRCSHRGDCRGLNQTGGQTAADGVRALFGRSRLGGVPVPRFRDAGHGLVFGEIGVLNHDGMGGTHRRYRQRQITGRCLFCLIGRAGN